MRVFNNDLRTQINSIKAPTPAIAGTGDIPTPPSDLRFIQSQIEGAQYLELDAAHISNQQQVESFGQALVAFLSNK
jgi:3-oxoadipate enol-lactonase